MAEEKEEKKGFFHRLVAGLSKTRDNIVSGIDSIFSGFSSIDEDFYEEIEEILIMGDIGINATNAIISDLKQKVKERGIKEPEACKQLLIDSIREQMSVGELAYEFENRTSVVLVIGVNGVGKTTSVGKLAGKLKASGSFWQQRTPSVRQPPSSSPSGPTGPGWRSSAARRALIRQPWCMTPYRRPRRGMRMCCCATPQADFTIRRI